ncbi:FliH/SctL family protein [Chitinibacter tainanensis]|uniref:FliH/SctL family protein n=1 Tax=Chitinibacter tainanensis TaxID=230667 RepID=UPI0004234240|nr:FliH/SctL family protein [Chitinibacter tainanensis]
MTAPNRRIIPSEELSEFQRWQFNSLLGDHKRPAFLDPLVHITASAEAEPAAEMSAAAEPVAEELAESVHEPVEQEQADVAADLAPVADAMPYPTAEEIEAIQQQAHEEGYQAGLAEGRAQAAAELQQLQNVLSNATAQLQAAEPALADSVLELALLVARQMVGEAMHENPKLRLAQIREALDLIPSPSNPSRLYLAPSDLDLLAQDLQFELPPDVWKIIPDEQLASGSCRIETPVTQLEYSLASRWEKITGVLPIKQPIEWSGEQYMGDVSTVTPTAPLAEPEVADEYLLRDTDVAAPAAPDS